MTEINIRYVTDKKDNKYYPITHMDAIEGFDISQFEDMADMKEDLESIWDQSNDTSGQLSSLQSKVSSIESSISNMIRDTGWMNVQFLNNTTAHSLSEVPKARLVSFNGVNFISLKGAFKGLTSNNMDIGKIPNEISSVLERSISFAQNMSVSGENAHFTRMKLSSDGIIKIEGATLSTVSENQWFPVDATIMI